MILYTHYQRSMWMVLRCLDFFFQFNVSICSHILFWGEQYELLTGLDVYVVHPPFSVQHCGVYRVPDCGLRSKHSAVVRITCESLTSPRTEHAITADWRGVRREPCRRGEGKELWGLWGLRGLCEMWDVGLGLTVTQAAPVTGTRCYCRCEHWTLNTEHHN